MNISKLEKHINIIYQKMMPIHNEDAELLEISFEAIHNMIKAQRASYTNEVIKANKSKQECK